VRRYTHRVAISNNRILDIEGGQVKFLYKDYRDDNQQKIMTLSADEFIRCFLLHVLPDGFQRIRHYGFLANRNKEQKIARCRELLGMKLANNSTEPSEVDKDYRDLYEELTGASFKICPSCLRGHMIRISVSAATVKPSPLPGDTS
jgi:hypothetical protein